MSELAKCPHCNKEIESDSFYCDQCGEALKLCKNGHGFKKGKICSHCGNPLVEASKASMESQKEKTIENLNRENLTERISEKHNTEPSQSNTSEKTIRNAKAKSEAEFFVGKNINAKLKLIDGAIVGRRTGDYISTFSSQGYVSGTHAKFQRNSNGKWEIVDLNSTNGTFVNGVHISPETPVVISIGDEISFYDTTFIIE